ncbi:unnamed protein product, partial [Staurois parvus]
GLPGPCIHYIRSPRTLHSLYPLSPDPAFTISGLPGPCIHYIRSPRTLHSLYLVSPDPAFTISGLPGPCIHYIWSPTVHTTWKCTLQRKKTTSLEILTKLSMCRVTLRALYYQQ